MKLFVSVPVLLLAATTLVVPTGAEAQGSLSPALWDENISLDVTTLTNESTEFTGSDLNVPEAHTEELSGNGFAVSGVVQFGTAAPPEGVARVTWDITNAGTALDLGSRVSIDFAARVVETSTPPVEVAEVPVHLTASGSAEVTDVFGSRGTSFFRFQAIGTAVLIQENLDISGNGDGPTSDAFAIDETNPIPPGAVILIGMAATASMGTVSTEGATTGSAMGMVDPVIEVADEIIPGTSSSYRDFFEMEFSPGWDAQTPVEPVSFGEIKRRFGPN